MDSIRCRHGFVSMTTQQAGRDLADHGDEGLFEIGRRPGARPG
jgi:hypothetical protein